MAADLHGTVLKILPGVSGCGSRMSANRWRWALASKGPGWARCKLSLAQVRELEAGPAA